MKGRQGARSSAALGVARTIAFSTSTGVAAILAGVVACGGGSPPPPAAIDPGGSRSAVHWPADDRSLCQVHVHWKNNTALQVQETVGPGSIKPNIRRVIKIVGDRDNQHAVLLCREIDTNLDGIKDVVRIFNEKGEPLHEEADTNFDGKLDHWVNFADGRIEEEDVDTTLSTGRPNLWKFYVNGELSRVRRNTHCASGKADTWEIYYKNRLERIGNDVSCDGHVDRWDRDSLMMAQEEAQQAVEIADGGTPPLSVGPRGDVVDGSVAAAIGAADAGRARRPNK